MPNIIQPAYFASIYYSGNYSTFPDIYLYIIEQKNFIDFPKFHFSVQNYIFTFRALITDHQNLQNKTRTYDMKMNINTKM